jgi:glucose 1-dehydrogenase
MNKKAYVTGASHGIGRGIALVLAEQGYDIAFTYNRREDAAQRVEAELRALGVQAFAFQAELQRPGVAEEVTAKAIAALGGVDLFVGNAGRMMAGPLQELSGDQVDFAYHLFYRSNIMATALAVQSMREQRRAGSVIYITSTRAFRAHDDDCLYGSMKAALNRAVESLALELAADGIRVNAVAPGNTWIHEDLTPAELRAQQYRDWVPLGRPGSPREVGQLVAYLASEQAAYITGEVVKIDGGLILPGVPETFPGRKPMN